MARKAVLSYRVIGNLEYWTTFCLHDASAGLADRIDGICLRYPEVGVGPVVIPVYVSGQGVLYLQAGYHFVVPVTFNSLHDIPTASEIHVLQFLGYVCQRGSDAVVCRHHPFERNLDGDVVVQDRELVVPRHQ